MEVPPAYAAIVKRIAEKLNEKGKTRQCPLCGTNSWIIGKYVALHIANQPALITAPGMSPFGFRPEVQTYPTVAVFCSNCGNTQLLNLLVLGFTEPELQSLTLPPLAPNG